MYVFELLCQINARQVVCEGEMCTMLSDVSVNVHDITYRLQCIFNKCQVFSSQTEKPQFQTTARSVLTAIKF